MGHPAPASTQIRAVAGSRGPPRLHETPAWAPGARWPPAETAGQGKSAPDIQGAAISRGERGTWRPGSRGLL